MDNRGQAGSNTSGQPERLSEETTKVDAIVRSPAIILMKLEENQKLDSDKNNRLEHGKR